MNDNLYVVSKKFFSERNATLDKRFTGRYRAVVVETNDPLNMFRVRFRCPELHSRTLKAEECPWAVPSFDLGGKRAGHWTSPCIGDYVWITFEKDHAYGPVWSGFANPTRRKNYPYPSVSQPTPLSVNDRGQADSKPDDYDTDYLPKDGRPMSVGTQDRYGNLDLMSAVGFFPSEHAAPPPSPDFDPLQKSAYDQANASPEVNSPDLKFMLRATKGGMIFKQSDQGYYWKKDGGTGEFVGGHVEDEEFEIKRWKYLQKLLSEDDPVSDQRQQLLLNRYGSRFEMRDTGWAQPGPISSKTRDGEYGEPCHLSKESTNDYRWAKLRTKGGWLLQAYDKGYDPQEDEWIKRPILEEIGAGSEKEDEFWGNKDSRWFRMMGRHFKIVIDERGTDKTKSFTNETPRGNGILLKGRRTGGSHSEGAVSGDPRGFYFEFNENDDANHTTWGTPLGHAIEMNDATEYVAIVAGLARDYARPWKNIEENEFLLEPVRARDPDLKSYHLILDHANEFLSLKTRGGQGEAARDQANPSDAKFNQGLEARDGSQGDGAWTEIVDSEHRGMWMSKNENLHIMRAKDGKKIYLWFDDNKDEIVIYNGEGAGKINLYSVDDVVIKSTQDVVIHAKNIELKADDKIKMEAGGTPLTMRTDRIDTTADIHGKDAWLFVHGAVSIEDVNTVSKLNATTVVNEANAAQAASITNALNNVSISGSDSQGGNVTGSLSNTTIQPAQQSGPTSAPTTGSGAGDKEPGGEAIEAPIDPSIPTKIEPTDRAKQYNAPVICPQDEVEHPIG